MIFSRNFIVRTKYCLDLLCFISNKEFFFKPLSSIMTALTPTLSKVFYCNSSVLVFPSIPIINHGFIGYIKISFIEFNLDVVSTASMSGLPLDTESVKELNQKPSNSIFFPLKLDLVFSTIRAEIGLCTSKILKVFLLLIRCFNICCLE